MQYRLLEPLRQTDCLLIEALREAVQSPASPEERAKRAKKLEELHQRLERLAGAQIVVKAGKLEDLVKSSLETCSRLLSLP